MMVVFVPSLLTTIICLLENLHIQPLIHQKDQEGYCSTSDPVVKVSLV